MKTPNGIGPHEGRERELMLAGEKPMAMFSDVVPASMDLPLEDFAPYLTSGQVVRCEDVYYPKPKALFPFRFVYFALRNEAWRIEEMRTINRNMIEHGQCASDATDEKIGYLLGYSPEQVEEFISWQRHLKSQDSLL